VAVLANGRFAFPRAAPISWMDHSADGRLLAVPWNDTVALFETETGRLLRTLGAVSRPTGVAFSPDGKRLVLGGHGTSDNLAVWDCETGQRLHELPGHTDVYAVAWSSDGTRIVSGSSDGRLKVWDGATGREVASGTTWAGCRRSPSPPTASRSRSAPTRGACRPGRARR
jgi:WD40 repeat protein